MTRACIQILLQWRLRFKSQTDLWLTSIEPNVLQALCWHLQEYSYHYADIFNILCQHPTCLAQRSLPFWGVQNKKSSLLISWYLAASAIWVFSQGPFSTSVELHACSLVLAAHRSFCHFPLLVQMEMELLILKMMKQKELMIWTSIWGRK